MRKDPNQITMAVGLFASLVLLAAVVAFILWGGDGGGVVGGGPDFTPSANIRYPGYFQITESFNGFNIYRNSSDGAMICEHLKTKEIEAWIKKLIGAQ